MSTSDRHYWSQFVDDDGQWASDRRPPGEDLAALRTGLGREPGTVPALWRFHRVRPSDQEIERGWQNDRYVGEHHALTLYAVHQQSQDHSVHKPGVGLGTALRALHVDRGAGDASKAIDRRFYAAVTASSVDEVAHHLRGLIRMLRNLKQPAPLDYSRLAEELASWQNPERRDRVRRRWGLEYHAPAKPDDAKAEPAANPT